MSDYWYKNRHELVSGKICRMNYGNIVKLDRRVPGDGTDWYVLDQETSYIDGRKYWADNDSKIHPSEIEEVLNDSQTD